MGIKKFLEDEFGFTFDSKDELKKKRLKELLVKLAKREKKIKKIISKGVNKKTRIDLEEDLKIISYLRKQKVKNLRNLIKK